MKMAICDELDSAEFVKRRREGKVSICAPLQTSQQYPGAWASKSTEKT